MKYQPRLDGFRGLCVAAVFLFHAQFLDFGWIGVQAFFVLSGFLITAVLLEGKQSADTGWAYFRDFYARRALRIFPVYFVYIGVIAWGLPLAWPAMADAIRAHVPDHLFGLLTYTYNFSRLDGSPASPFFGHLWSLSIEEQFYFAWPLCVLLLRREALVRLCVGLVVAGPVVRAISAFLSVDDARTIYFLTTSQVDAFAAGALLTLAPHSALARHITGVPLRWATLGVLLATAIVAVLSVMSHVKLTALGWPLYMPNFGASIWGYTVLNLWFMVLLANIGAVPLVGNAAIRRLGRVSYGFYIFHFPMLWAFYTLSGAARGTFTALNIGVSIAAFIATWLAAEASFKFVERPFLRLKDRFGASRASAPALEGAMAPSRPPQQVQ